MPLFRDACALVKRYLTEGTSSHRMQQITGRFDRWGGFAVSAFIEPECVSALAKYARVHANAAVRTHLLATHARVVDRLRRDLSSASIRIVDVEDDFVVGAADLLKRHPEYEIGAGDAIHLVTALSLQRSTSDPLIFVTADAGLERAARREGLATMNPNTQDVATLEALVGMN